MFHFWQISEYVGKIANFYKIGKNLLGIYLRVSINVGYMLALPRVLGAVVKQFSFMYLEELAIEQGWW